MASPSDFANGLDGIFDGVMIKVKQGAFKNPDTTKGAPPRLHQMTVVPRSHLFNKFFDVDQSCTFKDESFTIYISYDKNDYLEVGIIHERGSKEKCFGGSFTGVENYFDEDHESFIFIAGRTENYFANGMYVSQTRFVDTQHIHDMEQVDKYVS